MTNSEHILAQVIIFLFNTMEFATTKDISEPIKPAVFSAQLKAIGRKSSKKINFQAYLSIFYQLFNQS